MQTKIDEDLYSRQIGTYGAEAMGKLIKMKVFVQGMRGLGVEIAKNLVLAGPSQVVIHDQEIVQIQDLGSNFFFQNQHVGKVSRAQGTHSQLQELNTYVNVQVYNGQIDKKYLENFDIVCFTEQYNQDFLEEMNAHCRSKNIGFIYAGLLGLYGFTFVDFGDVFKCFDQTGEENKPCLISSISQDKEGIVLLHEEKKHPYEDGDTIQFREVQGMTELNGKNFQVKVINPNSFKIGDTSKFNDYTREGICEQIKVPVTYKFKSLKTSLLEPYAPGKFELDNCDFEKFGRPELLHFCLNGLLNFTKKNDGKLPQINNQNDYQSFLKILNDKQKNQIEIEGGIKIDQIDEKIVQNISNFARAQISPLCSFWGGIVCQEIIKFTGKYTPLRQWLHYDVFECLPDNQVNRQLQNNRYDDQISIFGQELQKQLSNQKIFIVGAGALGCEFLKMFALMGISSNKEGKVYCTDDDVIATSNLNRQFLFRKENVGKNKSACACNAVKQMNSDFQFESMQLQVGPQNEQVFNDDFWDSLDCVVNAVDNVKARLFIDGRCVFYQKPLLESGTLGTKCNSQVILPKLTQPYGDSQDPPEESIPLCTLKNFPYLIEHTIQWGRDYFEGVFVDASIQCDRYLKNPQQFIQSCQKELSNQNSALLSRLESVQMITDLVQANSFEQCVIKAKEIFQDIFHDMIAQMLYTFPLDQKTSEGTPFWTGQKRPPQVIDFDSNDQQHMNFILSTCNILAFICGIQGTDDIDKIKQIVDSKILPKFVPKNVEVETKDPNTVVIKSTDDDEKINILTQKMLNQKLSNTKINIIEFEKDDDENCHIDFMAATANLRARNYKIKEVERFKIKMIAGKIIPAIATATAMVVGAVGLELLKLTLKKPVEVMKNSFMNLALPLWLFSEPMPPLLNKDKDYDPIVLGPIKAIPNGFSSWDSITMVGPLTLEQLIQSFSEKYQINISIISSGQTCVYNKYVKDSQMADRLKLEFLTLYQNISKKQFPSYKKYLEIEVSGETNDGIDIIMPSIKYQVQRN